MDGARGENIIKPFDGTSLCDVEVQNPLTRTTTISSLTHLQLHLQVREIGFGLLRQDIPQCVLPFLRMVNNVPYQWPEIYSVVVGGGAEEEAKNDYNSQLLWVSLGGQHFVVSGVFYRNCVTQ